MIMNNKIKSTISVVTLIAAIGSNNVFAGSSENFFMPALGTDKGTYKASKSHQAKECNFLDALEAKENKDKISFNDMFGIELEFSEGKISIKELEETIEARLKIALTDANRTTKSSTIEEDTVKILGKVRVEVWQKSLKEVQSNIKQLKPNDKDSLAAIKAKYRARAIEWFTYKYGIKTENNPATKHFQDKSTIQAHIDNLDQKCPRN